jgi:CubicO group peptidase (beta-lactamase class C family)
MKKILKYLLLLALLAIIYVAYTTYPKLNIISGYAAKNMNSSVFLAKRTPEITSTQDNNFSPINQAKVLVNNEEKTTVATAFGLMKRKAVYREGLGSVLLTDDFDESTLYLSPKRTKKITGLPYPYGDKPQRDTLFAAVNYKALQQVVADTFTHNEVKKTRSVLVIYKDHIIAEKYADGFDKNSLLQGWSMTKSITATIYGILQSQGKVDINDKALIDSWQNDERANITINDLLHMNSGLKWEEVYDGISDVTKMLFLAKDMSKVQEEKPLVGKPNESWNYSSGTTNLLSGMLRKYFNSHQDYLDFWYSALIDKIGMHSMTVEADLSGNYVGSSYSWATTRDWGKFGLLYLHKGNWNGEQLFDESWVDYVKTPTNTSNGEYGGHFWLNAGGIYPDVPKGLFSANGFQGQRVFIIPSKDLVVVRMGLIGSSGFDFNNFLKGIIETVE